MNRRELLKVISTGAAVGVLPTSGAAKPAATPKALVFDTFGTVVDWRGSIIDDGKAWGKTKGVAIDWASFADRWRAGYAPSMDKVRKGELPWTKLDDLHRMILDELLMEFRMMPALTEEEKDHLNRVWHRLKPWPDSIPGLIRLKKKFTIAPLSNGNVCSAERHGEECRSALGSHSLG